MTDETWEEQFKRFLQKTGEDFRRAGEDIKTEAQKLLDAAKDPEKQQRVRNRLTELGGWARKAAHGVMGAVEEAASKAETAFHTATEKVTEKVAEMKRTPSSASTAATTAPRPAGAVKKKAGTAKGKPAKAAKRAKRKP